MKVLITGAKGFVGKNLVSALKNIKEGKDKTRLYRRSIRIRFGYGQRAVGGIL